MPQSLVGDRVNAAAVPGFRTPSPPRAIVRHRTPRPGEEKQVPALSRRGRRRLQALRAIPIGNFRTTWNRGGSLSGVITYSSLSFPDTSFPCSRECHLQT